MVVLKEDYIFTYEAIFQNLLKVVHMSLEVYHLYQIYHRTEAGYLVKWINFKAFSSFVNMEIQTTPLTTAMELSCLFKQVIIYWLIYLHSL